LSSPFNPFAASYPARATAAACEMFVNATRRYGKPDFGIERTEIAGESVPVVEEVVLSRPSGDLLRCRRTGPVAEARNGPAGLMVPPMRGHLARSHRGTREALLPTQGVYVPGWIDAREVPPERGGVGVDDYAEYVVEFCRVLEREH